MDHVFALIQSARQPLLLCGERGSGRTSLAIAMAATYQGPVTVIDPTSVWYTGTPGETVVVPNDHASDEAFYDAAAMAVGQASGLLIVDDFPLLAEPYTVPLLSQRRFLAAVASAVDGGTDTPASIVIIDHSIPAEPLRLESFGPKVLMGRPPRAVRSVLWPDSTPPDFDAGPGRGVLVLDGRIEDVHIPITEPSHR